MTKPNFVWLCQSPFRFLAFGFGSGLLPKAPGTWGSLTALPLVWLAVQLGPWFYLALTVIIAIVGIYICRQVTVELGIQDHPGIVWDEFAGIFITFLWVPITIPTVFFGFLCFRFFDILKPWPISRVDRNLSGGLGIMLDDLIAGVYALIVMQLWVQSGWAAMVSF